MGLLEDFWEDLVKIGPRFNGTQGEKHAIDLIEKYCKNIDISTDRLSFKYHGWAIRSKTELTILSPIEKTLDCYCFIWSPPTPNKRIIGRVEYLGMHEIWGHYEWKLFGVRNVSDQYIAYISGQNEYSAIPQALSEGYSLPHFCIGDTDTTLFLDLLRNNKNIIINGSICSEDIGHQTGYNIRLKLKNISKIISNDDSGSDNQYLLLTAHYDTLFNTPGAFDNAGGCALLLAIADWLSKNPLNYSVECLFTGAEEFNLSGSKAYCMNLKNQGDLSRIRAVVNLDGVGRNDSFEIWAGPEKFAINIWQMISCEDLGLKKILKYPPHPGSDHAPFYNEGVPVVMFSINDLPILHRPEDVIDNDKKNNLNRCLEVLKRFLLKFDTIEF